MTWDLETAYRRSGLDETPENDVILTATMDASVAVAEMWLNRKLAFATDLEAFPMAYSPDSLSLRRYPLTAVLGVTYRVEQLELPLTPSGTNIGLRYVASPETGILFFPDGLRRNEVLVEYEGGYEEFPPDLELALWMIFGQLLPTIMADDSGSGGLGAVESISVPDVGTVRFASASSLSSASGDSGLDYNPNIPYSAQALLQPYRREYV